MTSSVFLSILIPVYNWDIRKLLIRLAAQIEALSGEEQVEIVVLDDASSVKFRNQKTAEEISQLTYRELTENLGRASIRNELLREARGKYVLFLDADMLPDRDDFVQRYVDEVKQGKEILCGGISYAQCDKNDDQYSFYLYKSSKTESIPASVRQKAPWRYLFTSNILLAREIMESVPLNSQFSGYGFEDIEWGIRLSKSHSITHIENSCSHMGLLRKTEVYAKMCESISNYGLLISLHPELFHKMGAGSFASYLRLVPRSILRFSEKLLSFSFHRLSWNKILLLIFQLDKAVLLAMLLKDREQVSIPGKKI